MQHRKPEPPLRTIGNENRTEPPALACRSAESRIDNPTAVVVCFGNRVRSVETVRSVKVNHPGVPILARAKNSAHAAELRAAGADTVVTQTLDTGLELGTRLMTTMGIPLDETAYLVNAIRAADIPPVSAIGPEVGEGPPQPPESAMEGLDVDTKHDVRAIASQMAVVRSTSPTNGFRRVREMSEDESDDGESSEPVFRRSNSPIPGERGIMPGGDEISVSVGKKREEK